MGNSLKKMINLFIVIIIVGGVITGCIDNKPDTFTQAEKIEDFQYMFKVIEENYPFLEVNKRVNNIDWLAKEDEFMEEIKKTKNDDEFFKKLADILGQLNNRHTSILSKRSIEYLLTIRKGEAGDPWMKEYSNLQAVKRYGYSIDKKDFETQSEEENKFIVEDNIKKNIIDNNIGYIKIKTFSHLNLEVDKDTIKSFIREIKPLDAVIIDIRGNSGGTAAFWRENIVPLIIENELSTDFYYFSRGGDFTDDFLWCRMRVEDFDNLKEIKEVPSEIFTDFKYFTKESISIKPNESINFKGKVFLLVDEGVYSAAENFAVFANETGFATLIGERTGGDGILNVGPAVCTLPNSGLVFRFSTQLGTTQSGVCNEEVKTIPHYIVDAKITRDIKDDKCIQKAIELVGK